MWFGESGKSGTVGVIGWLMLHAKLSLPFLASQFPALSLSVWNFELPPSPE